MKIHRPSLAAIVCFSLVAFSGVQGAEETRKPEAPATDLTPAEDTSARWSDIKELSFDQREQFVAGAARLEARVDAQITELTARREAMKSTADTKDWDFSMKALVDARSYLKGMSEEATKATPQNWAQSKDRVGRAWVRTQEAYAKVKTSTTDRG